MTIPDFQSLMYPLLKTVGDGKEWNIRDLYEVLSQHFNLTLNEKDQLLPSGSQTIINNRVGWARTYLLKAGLLKSSSRGTVQITDVGQKVLREKITRIDKKYLQQFPGYVEFRKRHTPSEQLINDPPESIHTPLEQLETAYQELRDELSEELRRKVLASSPSFFERLVVDVLISMGYGGSKKEAGKAIGRSGDEGIDGVINEDKLGLDVIYIQAKKWEGSIGRPEIHKFVGALSGAKANKGVFITTSKFSKEAQSYVEKISQKVILIDGDQLMDFMVDNNVGVSLLATYQTKKVDNDYFEG